MALAALTTCVLRMLFRLRVKNQRWRIYNAMLLQENRWRAMRYGTDESLLDLAKGELVEFTHLIDEIQAIVEKDADALGCRAEIAHLSEIVKRGTSAHRQVQIYEQALENGCDKKAALREVVRYLIGETAAGAQ